MFPKSIKDNLPSDYKSYYTCIYNAYMELRLADEIGLITYKADDKKVTHDNTNYTKNLKTFKNNFEKYKRYLPENTELKNLPRNANEIKKALVMCLARIIDDDDKIREVLFAVFKGNTDPHDINKDIRLPKKEDKLEAWSYELAKKIRIKEITDPKDRMKLPPKKSTS